MHQMLEQLEETRSKGDGPIVVGVRGVPTLEHKHDDAVLPKRRNNTPSKGEIKKGKDGFLPPREVGPEKKRGAHPNRQQSPHIESMCDATQMRKKRHQMVRGLVGEETTASNRRDGLEERIIKRGTT